MFSVFSLLFVAFQSLSLTFCLTYTAVTLDSIKTVQKLFISFHTRNIFFSPVKFVLFPRLTEFPRREGLPVFMFQHIVILFPWPIFFISTTYFMFLFILIFIYFFLSPFPHSRIFLSPSISPPLFMLISYLVIISILLSHLLLLQLLSSVFFLLLLSISSLR